MSKYIIVLFFFLSIIPKSFSQSDLSNYSFVVVPERFDFLNEDDKYQLNSLAEFLFNKHGFHAFKSDKTPNAKRCDGLYADVINLKAILRTKFVIILRDCNGFEIYRSREGVTRLKEFKKAYQDAMRRAFAYFEGMGVKQKEIVYFDDEPAAETTKTETMIPKEASGTTTLVVTKAIEPMSADGNTSFNLPKARFSSYILEDATYMLRKTSEGYTLYKETTSTEDGLALVGKIGIADDTKKLYFIDTLDAVFQASFDASENLVIKKEGASLLYKRIR